MCKVVMNNKLNGVELYFNDKPSTEVRKNLKSEGFHWNGKKLCWYAKQNDNTLAVANTYGYNEENTEIKTAKKVDNEIDLFELTRIDNIEINKEVSLYNTKDIAKEVRTTLRKRFPFVKFSVTSDYNKIWIDIKSGIFDKNSVYLLAIKNYAEELTKAYRYDASDPMTDYFNCNFYFYNADIDEYEVSENNKFNIEKIKTLFDTKKAKSDKQQAERKEKEYQEYLKECERKEAEYKKSQAEKQIKKESINNNIKIVNLVENEQYFIKNSYFANMNKNNSINEYKEEIEKGDYYLQDCKVTKEIHLNKSDLNNFQNMLLDDFEFLNGTGGSYTDDVRINSMEDYNNMSVNERDSVKWGSYVVAVYCEKKLMFVIDAQGFSYTRYVGLIGEQTTIEKNINYNQLITAEEVKERTEKANNIIDIVNNVVSENNIDIEKIFNDSNKWYDTRNMIVDSIKANNKHLTKEIIQQVKEDNTKNILYKCLNEVNTIQDQCKKLNTGYITIVRGSMIGGCSVNHLELKEITYNENSVKLIGNIEGKHGLYEMSISHSDKDVLIYQGNLKLNPNVLWKNGATIYGSYDKEALNAVISYFEKLNILPIVNTFKTII